MSEICIHYEYLEKSIEESKKVRKEIADYTDEIKRQITTPISCLTGSDPAGYATTAASLARQKITFLNSKSSRFSSYETSVRNLISTAKANDEYVSSKMETIAGMYVEKRTFRQKVGDWIYNTFCVDFVNERGWTRRFADTVKWISNEVGDWIEKARNWFKYGEGRYVLNIASAIGKIALAISAIASVPLTGGATLSILLLGSSTISMYITMLNSSSEIESNIKALAMSEDNPGAARYYGNISTLSQKWEKTDMGDANTNKAYEIGGKVINTVKYLADTITYVGKMVYSAGAVRDYRYKNPDAHIKGHEYSLKNLKHNIIGEFGFYLTKPGIKNWKKLLETVDYTKKSLDFFMGQTSKVKNEWIQDTKTQTGVGLQEDPFDTIKSTIENIKSPFKAYETLNLKNA